MDFAFGSVPWRPSAQRRRGLEWGEATHWGQDGALSGDVGPRTLVPRGRGWQDVQGGQELAHSRHFFKCPAIAFGFRKKRMFLEVW